MKGIVHPEAHQRENTARNAIVIQFKVLWLACKNYNERMIVMSRFKMIALVAVLTLVTVGSVSAGWRHPHRVYYGYGPAYAPPVVVAAQPVVVAPAPVVASPVYTTSAVVVPASAPLAPVYAPAAVYAPAPVYSYGFVGPRRFGIGYATPAYGYYYGR
jgi:hypothetical protein